MSPDHAERRYQVFVSSTFRDLQEERQRVLQAILEMKAFPSGMELFPSADDEQWEFIKREIQSSDYYVVIAAGKYGSLAPDGNSFTEKEYDFAIEIGKPVMGFLFHDLDELKGSHLEQDSAAKEKLNLFRAKVQKGKLVKFYKNCDELKSQVWQALSHAFLLRPQEGWVRGKNSRRIEDLEEITRLQNRIIELEVENSKLKESALDPRLDLAQGADSVEWLLNLQQVRASGRLIDPPQATLLFRSTWNKLLAACFSRSMPSATQSEVESGLFDLVLSHIKSNEQLLGGSHWIEGCEGRSVEDWRLREDVCIQFAGLGFIDVDNKPSGRQEIWVLTEKGKLQLALVKGIHRPKNV